MTENKSSNTGNGEKSVRPQAGGSFQNRLREHWEWLTIAGVLLVLTLIGVWWFLQGRVSTDDAYVKAEIASISSRIKGSIIKVYVENDMHVAEGDMLVEMDRRDYQTDADAAAAVVDRMDADIQAAETKLSVLDKNTASQVQQAQAMIQQLEFNRDARNRDIEEFQKKQIAAKADAAFAKKEFERFQVLFGKGSVAERTLDDKRTALKRAESDLGALNAQIKGARDAMEAAQQRIDQAGSNLKIAKSNLAEVEIQRYQIGSLQARRKEAAAQLEQARLNLSYCSVKAPIAGFIAQKDIQLGDRVEVGQPFMAVVPLHAVYVEANYKETNLGDVRPGQRATVKADIYPGITFQGRVVGIRAGTGAAFALLPPQNATGNWIKVVQRVPVRIEFNDPLPPEYPLRVGLSLAVTIHTIEKTEKIQKIP